MYVYVMCFCFFFFKQKTAYEMRISDWSSDVCSSDLLLTYATQRLSSIEGLRIVGTAPAKASVISFTLDYAHPHDVGTVIDRAGVAVRAGHHCTQPLMDGLGLPAPARSSSGLYT